MLADLLTSYLEYELCRVSILGLPAPPKTEQTLATTSDFGSAIHLGFPFDTPRMTDPKTPPEGWESTFNTSAGSLIASEPRKFLARPSPYSLPLTEIFTPLRDVVSDTSPDPTSPDKLLNLVQPQMYCADANDPKNPLHPIIADGWKEYVWNGEKHYWVSDRVGARIRVNVKVAEGRWVQFFLVLVPCLLMFWV